MFTEKAAQMRRERAIDKFITLSSVVDDGIVMSRNGSLIATIRVEGIPFETADDEFLDRRADQLNVLLRMIAADDTAIQIHRIRRFVRDRLSEPSAPGFARDFTLDYNNLVDQKPLMATELYVTLIERDLAPRSKARSVEVVEEALMERLKNFRNRVETLLQSLGKYGPRHLKETEVEGVRFSEQLSFYNFLLTGCWQLVRIPSSPLYQALGNVQVFVGSDVLELQSLEGRKFAQSVEIKDYALETFSGILDDLLYQKSATRSQSAHYPFIETQTFAFLSKAKGLKALQLQQKQLLSSKDAGHTQILQMSAAMDGVANGLFVMGEYSYSLLVIGDTEAEARSYAQRAVNSLADSGLLPFISTHALVGSYLSQQPDAWSERPRLATLTSVNFAHLAPLHNFPQGKRNGNPWGEALALLRTPSGQPFYFNFHTSKPGENAFDKKTLANTTIIGTSGSGKTATLNALLALAQKYRDADHPLTTIYFDKDRGAEIAVRALDGGYLTIRNGEPTGFNPFQLDPTLSNVQFLNRFIHLILSMDGLPVTPEDEEKIAGAVAAVMSMRKEHRLFRVLLENMTEGATREEIARSVPKRLKKWVAGGELAWVFDNEMDTLDFNTHPNFGIDGTEFLDNRSIRSPIAFYLLHRLEEVIDGRRMFFIMDEFWKWLLDEAFSDFAFNKLKTIRKQNGFGVFATQSPSDVLTSPIAKAVIEQSATQIFLPNPKASREDYVDGFKVSDVEFEIIRALPEDSRTMLIKQGTTSVLCLMDLGPIGWSLKVLSGSTDAIHFAEDLRRAVGESPSAWLPYFLGQKQFSASDSL